MCDLIVFLCYYISLAYGYSVESKIPFESITDTEDIFNIVGGDIIKIEQAPYYAMFRPKGIELHCGASIINDQFLLTAKHCYTDIPTFVTVGKDILATGGTDYDVVEMFRDPHTDCMLLKLKTKLVFSSKVKPIKLAESNLAIQDGTKLFVCGFGDKKHQNPHEIGSQELRGVEVPVVNKKKCIAVYTGIIDVQESEICAGQIGKDSCQGDSGGPLVWRQNGGDVLVGVVSRGQSCAEQYPGLYVNVAMVRDFIDKTIAANS